MARRSYGTGSLDVRTDSAGRETWYGKWHANGRRVKRKIGPKRTEGSRDGLTRAQAEAELRRLMAEVQVAPTVGHSLTVAAIRLLSWARVDSTTSGGTKCPAISTSLRREISTSYALTCGRSSPCAWPISWI